MKFLSKEYNYKIVILLLITIADITVLIDLIKFELKPWPDDFVRSEYNLKSSFYFDQRVDHGTFFVINGIGLIIMIVCNFQAALLFGDIINRLFTVKQDRNLLEGQNTLYSPGIQYQSRKIVKVMIILWMVILSLINPLIHTIHGYKMAMNASPEHFIEYNSFGNYIISNINFYFFGCILPNLILFGSAISCYTNKNYWFILAFTAITYSLFQYILLTEVFISI